MDIVYESAGGKLFDSQETLQPTESAAAAAAAATPIDGKTAEINRRTEESFEKLEDGITKTYTAIESKASTWGASLSSWVNTNFHVNEVINETKKHVESLHLDEKLNETRSAISKNIDTFQKKVINDENRAKSKDMMALLSSKTNTYLDSLDKDLEQVENVAGQYATRFGQFLKDTVAVAAPESDDDELIDDDVANMLFNVKNHQAGLKVSASRTEAQLHMLHTSPELYLTKDADPKFESFKSTFKIEDKTEEITALLKGTASLEKISTELVPAKVTYNEFWARYFYMKNKILQQESTRKKLLGQAQQALPSANNEDLSWGDDDDDDDEEDNKGDSKGKTSATSSEGTYELNSVASSILEVNKQKSDKKTAADDDYDDDDDWE